LGIWGRRLSELFEDRLFRLPEGASMIRFRVTSS
jgi:hypothetical protein